ncbi:DUF1838 family protein [Nonomuraea africana]|uniref:DUF1838 domain-containing protein n=1 Tax=Nonomuraea africana TaxID=46171 RepID=A0ABR9K9L2_9ACTN|nr:DUF1838 family protein [Nonomuraea africana]MBE1558697.1 hypothetical protein [Nonomuraea africana]
MSDLRDFMRVRASADGAETVTWWTGDVYAYGLDEGPHHLFGFEGVNVARALERDGGWELLTKEAAAYLDPASRDPLDTWDNPFTGRRVDVQHVYNDPVNQRLRGFQVPATRMGDTVVLNTDILLAYPSPLKVADYPENSFSDTYRAMELFQFFASAAALEGDAPSVPSTLSWCRVSPWLPWMAMGQRPGALVYHCRGAKVGEVPGNLEALFGPLNAPAEWSAPNQTSWTTFVDRRKF